jgi:hypothetical protein
MKPMINTNKIMVGLLVVVMLGFILGAVAPVFMKGIFSKEEPYPRFQNGDMVTHTLSEREGQVIDNTFSFNDKSECWQVKVRMKKTEEVEKSLATKILGKKASGMFNNIPENYNEFELEKQ